MTTDEKKNQLLKRVFDLINNGEGKTHLEVDGKEATAIYNEIKAMRLNGEVTWLSQQPHISSGLKPLDKALASDSHSDFIKS